MRYARLLLLIALAPIFGSFARADTATTGDGRVLSNPTSNGDLKLRVNIGGTPTDVLSATGASGKIDVGASTNLGNGTNQNRYYGTTIVGYPSGATIGASNNGYPVVGYNFRTNTSTNAWDYNGTDFFSGIQLIAGGFKFLTAPSGTGGNPITTTSQMDIAQGGGVNFNIPGAGTFAASTGTNYAHIGSASGTAFPSLVGNQSSTGQAALGLFGYAPDSAAHTAGVMKFFARSNNGGGGFATRLPTSPAFIFDSSSADVLTIAQNGMATIGPANHTAILGGVNTFGYAHLNGLATYVDATNQGEAGSAQYRCNSCVTSPDNVIDWNGTGAGGALTDDDDVTIYGTCAFNDSPNTAARTTVYRIFAALHVEIAAGTATFTQSANAATATDTTGTAMTAPTLQLTSVTTTGGSGTSCAPCRATWGITNVNAGVTFGCNLNKYSRRGRAYWTKN